METKRSTKENKENHGTPKKMKRSITEENLILTNKNATFNSSDLNIQVKDAKVEKINEILFKCKSEIDDGEYFINECCNELKKQVQKAKEEKILQIEEDCNLLNNEIENYKEETLTKYLKNKQNIHEKFSDTLNELEKFTEKIKNEKNEKLTIKPNIESFDELIENCTKKLCSEKKQLERCFLDGNILKFDSNDQSSNLLGKIKNFKNVIDAECLKKDFSLNANFISKDLKIIHVEFEYFENGKILLAFCEGKKSASSYQDLKYHFYILDQEKKLIVSKTFDSFFNKDFECRIHVVANKIAFQLKNYSVKILDQDLNVVYSFSNPKKYTLVGSCSLGLYFVKNNDPNDSIDIIKLFDWSFNLVKSIGKIAIRNNSNLSLDYIEYFQLKNDRYYFLDSFELVIMNAITETVLRKIEGNFKKFIIDSNEKIILFTCKKDFDDDLTESDGKILFLNLDGDLIKEFNLLNFNKNLKEEDFEYYDDYMSACKEWIYASAFNSALNQILFFDRKTLTFFSDLLN